MATPTLGSSCSVAGAASILGLLLSASSSMNAQVAGPSIGYPIEPWEETCDFTATCAGGPNHLGDDARATVDQVVLSPVAGLVKESDKHTAYGGTVIIETSVGGQTVTVLLAHLRWRRAGDLLVRPLQAVSVGTPVGRIAPKNENGGWEPHLHIGIHKGAYDSRNLMCGKKKEWVYAGYTGCPDDVFDDWHDPSDFIAQHLNLVPIAGFTMTAGGLPPATDGQTLNPTVAWNVGAEVLLSAAGRSIDPEGGVLQYDWTIDGYRQQGARGTFSYFFGAGMHAVTLTVTDNQGASSAAVQGIVEVAGSSEPQTFPITQLTNNAQSPPVGISRDGSTVFYTQSIDAGNRQLLSVRSDGSGDPRPILPSNLSVLANRIPPLVEVRDKIAFIGCPADPILMTCQSSNLGYTANVYVINVDGTGVAQLTADGTTPVFYDPVRISADGMKVVYLRNVNLGGSTWFIVDTDGGGASTELPFLNFVGQLSMNTDGSRLGFTYRESAGGNNKVGILELGQTAVRELFDTQENAFFIDLALSGDGRVVALARNVSFSESAIQLLPADGSASPQTLDSGANTFLGDVSTTHDGSLLCYLKGQSPTNVFCANASGGAPINVTNITTAAGVNSTGLFLSENGAAVTFSATADLVAGQNSDLGSEVFVSFLRPSLSIDGAPAKTRPQGETFTFTGFGFRPSQPVSRRVRQPDGVEVTLDPILAGTDGTIAWTFQSALDTPTGTYRVWVVDETTGKISNIVYETIVP